MTLGTRLSYTQNPWNMEVKRKTSHKMSATCNKRNIIMEITLFVWLVNAGKQASCNSRISGGDMRKVGYKMGWFYYTSESGQFTGSYRKIQKIFNKFISGKESCSCFQNRRKKTKLYYHETQELREPYTLRKLLQNTTGVNQAFTSISEFSKTHNSTTYTNPWTQAWTLN